MDMILGNRSTGAVVSKYRSGYTAASILPIMAAPTTAAAPAAAPAAE